MAAPIYLPTRALALALVTAVALFSSAASAVAQADGIVLYAASDSGRVLLRWVPSNVSVFERMQAGGTVVERAPSDTDDWAAVLPEPVRAADAEAFRALAERDEQAALFLMARFADTLSRSEAKFPGPARQLEEQRRERSLVGMGMAAAIYSREVAVAGGLFLVDEPPYGRYRYRVRLADDPAVMSEPAAVDLAFSTFLRPLTDIEATWQHRRVDLRWDWPADGSHAYVTVERQVGDGSWEALEDGVLTGAPGEEVVFRDSLHAEGAVYRYRLRGHDYFHRRSAPSATVQGVSLPAIAISTPYVERTTEVPPRMVDIAWSMDPDGDSTAVRGQQVFRALVIDGAYVPISPVLSPEVRTWRDSVIEADDQYYRVVAFDEYGRRRAGAPAHFLARDTTPPAAPTGLTAAIDSAGVVRLAWAPNTEPDFRGYRVFYSTSRREPGVRITDYYEEAPARTDTVAYVYLRDSVYYRVVALDDVDNASAFSAPVAIGLPDVHPPRPAVLVNAVGDTSGVSIEYRPSTDADVARYRWQRRPRGTADWYAFRTVPAAGATGSFRDTAVTDEFAFEYRVEVFDSTGLRAVSNAVVGQRLRTGYRQGVVGLSAKLDPERRAVELTWRYPDERRVHRFRVYRALGDAPLQTYALLAPAELDRKGPHRRRGDYLYRYFDEDAALGADYRYEIQAEWTDGTQSRPPAGGPVNVKL